MRGGGHCDEYLMFLERWGGEQAGWKTGRVACEEVGRRDGGVERGGGKRGGGGFCGRVNIVCCM